MSTLTGANITLMAVPNPGYVFTGWLQGIGNSIQAYVISFSLYGPVVIYPQFLRAGAVTIATNQPGLQVLADRTPVFSPVTLDWGPGDHPYRRCRLRRPTCMASCGFSISGAMEAPQHTLTSCHRKRWSCSPSNSCQEAARLS